MRTEDPRGNARATDQDPGAPTPAPAASAGREPEESLGAPHPIVPGCRGCARDGHGENHRDWTTGRMIAGHSTNPAGRPKGRLDDTTLIANEKMRSLAEKAVDVLASGLDSPVDWVRFGAARTVLERTLPKDASPDGPADVGWMEYLTDREIAALGRMIERARERMPIQEPPDGDEIIDVPARPVLPPRPAPADPFTVETLPAPGSEQPPEPVEPEDEEFET